MTATPGPILGMETSLLIGMKTRLGMCQNSKRWYIYNGRVWEPDSGNLKAMELCKDLADALAVYALSIQDEKQRIAYQAHVGKWQRRNNRETILKDAASVHPVSMTEFDQDPYLFNCKNGTLDLRTREFRAHSPGDLLATISGVKYDPEATSELWSGSSTM